MEAMSRHSQFGTDLCESAPHALLSASLSLAPLRALSLPHPIPSHPGAGGGPKEARTCTCLLCRWPGSDGVLKDARDVYKGLSESLWYHPGGWNAGLGLTHSPIPVPSPGHSQCPLIYCLTSVFLQVPSLDSVVNGI